MPSVTDHAAEIESREDFFLDNLTVNLSVTSAAAVIKTKLLEEEFPLSLDTPVSKQNQVITLIGKLSYK